VEKKMRDRLQTRKTTTIAVSKTIMDRLFKVRNELENKNRKHISYSGVISHLLDIYDKRGDKT
jgi:hypothetical protein